MTPVLGQYHLWGSGDYVRLVYSFHSGETASAARWGRIDQVYDQGCKPKV